MIRLIASFALLSLAAMPALSQTQPATPPAPVAAPPLAPPQAGIVRVVLNTSLGPVTIDLEKEKAPITTANFLRYVDQKRLDGTSFYRAVKVASDPPLGLVQAGTKGDPKRSLPPIAHEATSKTGLSHLDGTISMARGAPGTASGDFFITIGALPSFDADPSQPGDNLGFAAFGHVVEGMDVVRRILDSPTSPTEGEGVMKGQMIAQPVRILSARRTD